MKALSVLLLALAASTAVAFLGGFAAGATLLFASAFAAIFALDYSRSTRGLALKVTVGRGVRTERFGLAA